MIKTFKTEPIFETIKDVNKNVIRLFYFMPYKRENSINRKVMLRILNSSNNEYRTSSEFSDILDKLYIMKFNVGTSHYESHDLIDVTMEIPKLGLIDEFDLDKAIKILHDTIYDQYVEDGEFKTSDYPRLKENLIKNELDYPHSIKEFAYDQFLDYVDEERITYLHRDEYLKALEAISPKTSYEYYKEAILDNNYFTYIMGSADDKDIILKTFNKYFKQDKDSFDVDIISYKFLDFKKLDTKEITTKYNQSVIAQYYDVKDIKKEDLDKLDILYYFLNSRENDLIFKKLRNEHNLIYFCGVNRRSQYGVIDINAFFSISNLDQIRQDIKDVFDSIKIKENFERFKENLLRAMGYDLLGLEDNIYTKANEKFKKMIEENYKTIKECIELYKNITFEEMLEFLNRVELTKEMLMIAGEDND